MGAEEGFIGRTREMSRLSEALDHCRAGRGRSVVITGERGVGKTRLADELLAQARAAGARVAQARCCNEAADSAYWPWIQMLGTLPGDDQRLALFESVVETLRGTAAENPLVLVIDGLHLADVESLALLDFVTCFVPQMAVLVLVLSRLEPGGRLSPGLSPAGALDRLPGDTDRLHLGGLNYADSLSLFESASSLPPSPEALSRMWAVTAGNPGLILEMAGWPPIDVDRAEGGPWVSPLISQVALGRLLKAESSGRAALARTTYAEAVAELGRAVVLSEVALAGREVEHCWLLLALTEAHSAAGQPTDAARSATTALGLARRVGSAELIARVVLAMAGDVPAPGVVDEARIMQLEEARREVGPDDHALVSRITARLATELYFTDHLARRDELSAEALESARQSADPRAVVVALSARHYALFGPNDLEGRLAVATEMLAVATSAGDLEGALCAHWWRVSDLLEAGNIIEVDREIAVWSRLAASTGQPRHRWGPAMVSAARANLAGRIGDCEGLAYQAQAIGQDSVAENAFTYFSAQFFSVRRWQCRLGEFEAVVAGLTDSMPHLPLWRCALAYLYAELDRPEEAGTELARLAHDSYSALPRDASWLMAISLLADVAGYLADAENAALLYRLMGPYQDRVIVAGFAGVSHGSAARCLGVLASAMGRFESAQGHFETALRLNGRLGAAAWLAHTQVDYADMLGARGAPGDSARARQLVETAEAEFRDLGLDAFAARAGQRLDRLETPTAGVLSLVGGSAGNHAAEPGRGSPLFCRGGDYWEINFSGPSFRLRDSRGLRHLAQLLAEPGQEVHALVLLASVQGNASPCELAMASGDSGPILDSAAVSSYRRRLVDLSEDLDEAERFSDLERSAAIQRERDFILDELASGLGLGGRTRRASSAAERARISATKAIKGATRRIANEDAALGRHLTASVRTGYFCRYAPDPADTPDWTM